MCPLFPPSTVGTPAHARQSAHPRRRTMDILNICLVGFGSVNRALVRLVAREAEWLRKHHSLDVRFSAIVARHGAWEPRSGDYLPPVAVLARLADMVAAGEARLDAGSLAAATAALGIDAATVLATTAPPTAAVLELIARRLAPPADGRPSVACLAEAVDVDYAAGEPATSYLRTALSVGAHAVSANKASLPALFHPLQPYSPCAVPPLLAKGPVVHARASLLALARDKGVRFLHESAVMDGVPNPNPNPNSNLNPNPDPDPNPNPKRNPNPNRNQACPSSPPGRAVSVPAACVPAPRARLSPPLSTQCGAARGASRRPGRPPPATSALGCLTRAWRPLAAGAAAALPRRSQLDELRRTLWYGAGADHGGGSGRGAGGHMQCTCSAHAVYVQCTCSAHAGHMQCTCSAHAGHMHCTCTAHALRMHCACTPCGAGGGHRRG